MRLKATLGLILAFATSAFAEKRIPIGSLPLKNGSVVLVQEYLSHASLPEKVMVVSPFEEVYALHGGTVTKVLDIDGDYSVFIRNGSNYYVYNELKGVAVRDGDRVERGELIGELDYDSRYDGYEMEMQVWCDKGTKTCRLTNENVVCILKGTPYVPKVAKAAPAKHKAKAGKYPKGKKRYVAKKGSKSAKSRTYARKGSSKYSKAKAVKGKVSKSKAKAKKPVPKKKVVSKKKKR